MEDKFKKQLGKNRRLVEAGGPSPKVWAGLQEKLIADQRARRSKIMVRWSIAATFFLVLSIGSLFFIRQSSVEDQYTYDAGYETSLVYHTRQVQLRLGEIEYLKDPKFYKESRAVIDNLNMAYNQLRDQLPVSINKKKILESMIENLQIQELILNNRLQIIMEMQNI